MTHFSTFSRLRCLPAISWSLARWVSNVWPLGPCFRLCWSDSLVLGPFQGYSVHKFWFFFFVCTDVGIWNTFLLIYILYLGIFSAVNSFVIIFRIFILQYKFALHILLVLYLKQLMLWWWEFNLWFLEKWAMIWEKRIFW